MIRSAPGHEGDDETRKRMLGSEHTFEGVVVVVESEDMVAVLVIDGVR